MDKLLQENTNQVYYKFLLVIIFALWFNGSFSQNKVQVRASPGVFPIQMTVKDFVPNLLIVKYKTTAKVLNQRNVKPVLSLKCARVLSSSKIFETKSDALSNIYQVKFNSASPIGDVIKEVLSDPNVEYCEPSYLHRTFYTPNDPHLSLSNYLEQIKAFQAWDITRSSSKVVIGIVDSGSEINHEDLVGNIFKNELDPINNIDDDNDGYIDNFYGWDFVGTDFNNIREDNDPNVKNQSAEHGVNVSGLAAASSDNGKGISSVSFNAQLLIVKCAADNNSNTIVKGYEGIKYAVDHGAQIINCSWGNDIYSSYGKDIIDYALSKGCLIVAAAGNENTTQVQYPAAYPGVLAVSSVDQYDIKSPSSNYGRYIGISAPGVNILSTAYNNKYNYSTGTSMSAPIVSSAAALLKAYFKDLTMQQIGEQLRTTADDINSSNPNFVDMLGSGRLNILNALTAKKPSIRYKNIIYGNEGNIRGGDTVSVFLEVQNLLIKLNNVEISISSGNDKAKVLTPGIDCGALETLEIKKVGPFKIYLDPTISVNKTIEFKIGYEDKSIGYKSSEYFSGTFNFDYLNYDFNQITTTATSNGRIGYRNNGTDLGKGVIYKSDNLLYEASLIMGTSVAQLSNNARISINTADEHFVSEEIIKEVVKTDSIYRVSSGFNDGGNLKPLNVSVKHSHLVYKYPPDDKYVIVEYDVQNKNNYPLHNFYIGLLTDWDVDLNSNDVTKYIPAERLAYTKSKSNSSPVTGVKLLNTIYPLNYYPLTNAIQDGPLGDNVLNINEKFETISSGIKGLGIGEGISGNSDVSFVSGYGPVTIAPNSSAKFSFALLVNDNLNELEKSAEAAVLKFNANEDLAGVVQVPELKGIYPNPVIDKGKIIFAIPEEGRVLLTVYNIAGQKMEVLLDSILPPGEHFVYAYTSNLASGVYVYELRYKSFKRNKKMIVVK